MEDEMTDLGSTERRLLRALRAADEPSDEDRARVRARLLVKLGAASGVASAVATAATATGAATAAGTASVAPPAIATATTLAGFIAGSWKIGTAIVVVVGAAGGAAWITASSKTSDPSASAPHAADPAKNQVTKPAAASEARPESPRADDHGSADRSSAVPKSTRARERSAEPPASTRHEPSDLESELSLLENAQQAVKRGDSARALAALDRHATEHPRGALASERAGIRAVVLCDSGKIAEGQREARRFLSQHPKSPLAVRVRAACLDSKK
jgi:hypothetical protein